MNGTRLLGWVLFFNYYNPVSVYLTLFINLLFFLALSMTKLRGGLSQVRLYQPIILMSFLLCLWVLVLMISNGSFNTYVFGKYFRVILSSILIMMVINILKPNILQLIKVLSFLFLAHVIFVFIQVTVPQLDVPMAKIFGFNREVSILNAMTIRKLGFSSSFDTASLISLASMIFFFLRYLTKPKTIYILLSLLSLASTLWISRTGMVLGVLIFGLFSFYLIRKFKGRKRIAVMFFFTMGMLLAIYLMLPLIAASTVSFLLESQSNGVVVSNDDYSTGSTFTLLNSLYASMQISWTGFIFGLGIDPNYVTNRNTDIGYIKIIYHVGLVGTVVLFYLHYHFYRTTVRIRRVYFQNPNLVLISNFIILYILLLSVMNVKSLEIYSRGAYELLLISFLILVDSVKKETSHQESAI